MGRPNPNIAKRAKGFGNRSDLAKMLGVTVAAVSDAIRNGRVETDPVGWLHLETAATAFRATSNGSRNGGGAIALDDDGDPVEGGGETLASAKLRKEIAQADLAETKAREERGELVSVTEVRRLWYAATRGARQRLMAIPDMLAGRLGNLGTAQRRSLLDSEIRQALLDFPEDPPEGE